MNRRRLQVQQGMGEEAGSNEIHTVFVDNFPFLMNPKDLYSLFGKFGVVRDVFIPSKVRKATKSRFGFVRYDCPVAASVAIQKANGLWCDDKALKVKEAEFGRTMITDDKDTVSVKEVRDRQDGRDTLMPIRNTFRPIRNLNRSTAGHKSYAEVVQMG
ncbi:hypothetical protein ACSBR2_041959 [Camellia fascicularis]